MWKSVVISLSANSIDVVEMTVVAAFQSVKVDLSVTVDLEILELVNACRKSVICIIISCTEYVMRQAQEMLSTIAGSRP